MIVAGRRLLTVTFFGENDSRFGWIVDDFPRGEKLRATLEREG